MKKTFSFYKENKFFLNLALLCALFFANCFWGGMTYIVFPLLTLMALLDELPNGLSYLFFSLPFISLNVFASALIYFVTVAIYFAKFLIIQSKRKHVKNEKTNENEEEKPKKDKLSLAIYIIGGIFAVYSLISVSGYNTDFFFHYSMILVVLLLIYTVSVNYKVFRLTYNIRMLCYGLITASLFALTYFISPYLQNYIPISLANSQIPRFSALFLWPNVLAMLCSLILGILTCWIVKGKAKMIDYLLFGMLSILGILTFSKAFLIIWMALVLIVFVYLVKHYLKKTLIISGIVIALLAVIFIIKPGYVVMMFHRFVGELKFDSFDEFLNVFTTGRNDLWGKYLSYIFSHPLTLIFGKGLGAPILPNTEFSAHNMFITGWYELGLVGMGLFISLVVLLMIKAFKKNKLHFHWSNLIPIIIVLLLFLEEDLFFYIN